MRTGLSPLEPETGGWALQIEPGVIHTSRDLMSAASSVMMRGLLLTFRRSFVAISFEMYDRLSCRRNAPRLLGGLSQPTRPQHEDEQYSSKGRGPSPHRYCP